MKFFFRSLGYFTAIVFILSIQIRGNTIFSYIYQVISPAVMFTQDTTQKVATAMFDTGKEYGSWLINKSSSKIQDSVKSKMSSQNKFSGSPQEDIPLSDKNELDELIKSQ